MNPVFHPRRARLVEWLASGLPEQVDRHVGQCERCASRLEAIDTPSPRLRQALMRTLVAPEDLKDRMNERVESELRRRDEFLLLAGLLALPVETARLVLFTDRDDTSQEEDGQ